MNSLAYRACSFLESVHDPRLALFPYTTRVVDGRYASDFNHPSTIRYSSNCLLGLRTAEETRAGDAPVHSSRRRTYNRLSRPQRGACRQFRRQRALPRARCQVVTAWRRAPSVCSRAFVGAWLTRVSAGCRTGGVLVAMGCGSACTGGRRTRNNRRARPLSHPRARVPEPRFSGPPPWPTPLPEPDGFLRRDHLISCKRCTSTALGRLTSTPETLFRYGARRVVSIQGTEGVAMVCRRPYRRSRDLYPIYSVHQDSMAMLFLLPALDRGLPGTRGGNRA